MIKNFFKRTFLFVAVSIFSFNLHAADWTMASGYPKSNFHTQNIIKFIEDVKSTTSVNINLNPNDTLIKFAETLEKVCIECVENGSMTKDLAILIGPDSKYLTTNQFLDEIDGNLKKKLN